MPFDPAQMRRHVARDAFLWHEFQRQSKQLSDLGDDKVLEILFNTYVAHDSWALKQYEAHAAPQIPEPPHGGLGGPEPTPWEHK